MKLASLFGRVVPYLAKTTANVYTMNANASQQYLEQARCIRGLLEPADVYEMRKGADSPVLFERIFLF